MPAADAGTAIAALGSHLRIALDGDIAAAAKPAAADAGTARSAGGLQAALGFIFVGDGELAGTVGRLGFRSGGGVLLHAGTDMAALEGIFPIQLQGHIAIARDLDSRFTADMFSYIWITTAGSGHIDGHAVQGDIGFCTVCHIDGDRRLAAVILGRTGGVADDNVHILYRHIGGGVPLRLDGDGVGGGYGGLGNHRCAVLHRSVGAVGHGLSAFRGIHGDAALGKVIFRRESRQRQAADKQQGHHARKKSSQLHRDTVSFHGLRSNTYVPGFGTNIYDLIIAGKSTFAIPASGKKWVFFSVYLYGFV